MRVGIVELSIDGAMPPDDALAGFSASLRAALFKMRSDDRKGITTLVYDVFRDEGLTTPAGVDIVSNSMLFDDSRLAIAVPAEGDPAVWLCVPTSLPRGFGLLSIARFEDVFC
jgi:hypothetical protein